MPAASPEHRVTPSRFGRPVHRAIHGILCRLNAGFLRRNGILFGGGTRIAMSLNEFRESVDLLMMEWDWGPVPDEAWREVERHYGASAHRDYHGVSSVCPVSMTCRSGMLRNA